MKDISEKNKIKGEVAEHKFKEWLDKHKIPYMYIQQDVNYFSSVFKDYSGAKRPDFMILIPYFGLIFVDVKHRKLNKQYETFILDCDEVKKYSKLQREFNLHIWYALSNEEFGYNTWFWIPVSKILEEGIASHTSQQSNTDFFAISPTNFTQVPTDSSLDRLFLKLFERKK